MKASVVTCDLSDQFNKHKHLARIRLYGISHTSRTKDGSTHISLIGFTQPGFEQLTDNSSPFLAI